MVLEILNFSVEIALLIYKLFRRYSESKAQQDLNTFLSQVNIKFQEVTNNNMFAEAVYLHGIPPLLVRHQNEKRFKRSFQKFYDVFNDVQKKYHLESVIDEWEDKFKMIYQKYGVYNKCPFNRLNEHYKKEVDEVDKEIRSKKNLIWGVINNIIKRKNLNLDLWVHTPDAKPPQDFASKENYNNYTNLLKQETMKEMNLSLNTDNPLDFFVNDVLEEQIKTHIPFNEFKEIIESKDMLGNNIRSVEIILNLSGRLEAKWGSVKEITLGEMLDDKFNPEIKNLDNDFFISLNKSFHQNVDPNDTIQKMKKEIRSYMKK